MSNASPAQNGSGDRLDRIETILLDLATASVRHDNEFSRINATLDRLSEQADRASAHRDRLDHDLDRINATLDRVSEQQAANMHQIALHQEGMQDLKASITDLRNLVADYIQGQAQKDGN